MKNLLIASLCLIAFGSVYTQSKSNLNIVNELIAESVEQVLEENKIENEVSLAIFSPQPLEILKTAIAQTFIEKGIKISTNVNLPIQLTYSIINIQTEYGTGFTNEFLGELKSERTIKLTSSAAVTRNGQIEPIQNLNFERKDTINISEISAIENGAIPFTQAANPSVSLFSNLLEPILIVGTLIGTVILLFTIRSK